jgi:hypothetical protein
MVARKRSDTHYEEAHMSRIATLTAVLTMLVAPTALAGPIDLRSPDVKDAATPTVTKVDLRSPDTVDVFTQPVGQIDLRSPDAVDVFTPAAPVSNAAPSDGGFNWDIVALIAAALAACAGLAVMLRRHLDVGRPVGV